jgi:hypothetical protein
MMKISTQFHGGVRGADVPKRSDQFEGRFGRMFRTLPAAHFEDRDLHLLAAENAMLSEPETDDQGRPSAEEETVADGEENFAVSAGQTYIGQFIDHDITFDPVSSLDRQNDPEALTDFRTPRLDLDSLYGSGPDDQPYLYDPADLRKFALGSALTRGTQPSDARDLPRFNGRALIGDKRNDENVIVSQLHGAFLRFHNAVCDLMGRDASFEAVQQQVRWHYQYMVLNDFLPNICGAAMVASILPHFKTSQSIFVAKPQLRFFRWKNEPFIPIEFSAAAYRFGHSMVRPIYRLNTELDMGGEGVGENDALRGRNLIFAGISSRALNGFKPFNSQWAIDWKLFFGTPTMTGLDKHRVQPAYKMDASIVNPLGFLPEFSRLDTVPPLDRLTQGNFHPPMKPGEITHNLALRNLLRGRSMGLPNGQAIARAMGVHVLQPDEILIGKAAFEDDDLEARSISLVAPALARNTPLWAYVLAEAAAGWQKKVKERGLVGQAANFVPMHLGEVGGRIVAETLIGLMLGDKNSFLRQHPSWVPWAGGKDPDFDMRKLLKVAGLFN